MVFYKIYKKEINRLLFYIAFVLLVYLFVKVLFWYIAPFFIAFLLSCVFEPVVNFCCRRKMPRALMAVLCIVFIAVGIGMAGTNIFLKILEQGRAFGISESINVIKELYADILAHFPDELNLENTIKGASGEVANSLGGMFAGASAGFVKSIPKMLIASILCLVTTFFLIKDKQVINAYLMERSGPVIIDKYRIIRKIFFETLGGYLKAQLILMSVTFALSLTGLALLKEPYALFLGFLIAVIDALPILGSGFILWPWALVSAIYGNYTKTIGLLLTYGIIFIARQSLEPKILGMQIGIYPVVLLMSIYAGLKLFGVFGFFIGPLIVVTINMLQKEKMI